MLSYSNLDYGIELGGIQSLEDIGDYMKLRRSIYSTCRDYWRGNNQFARKLFTMRES